MILNKLKNDLHEILAGVKHCYGFEARLIIVTRCSNFSLRIFNHSCTLKFKKIGHRNVSQIKLLTILSDVNSLASDIFIGFSLLYLGVNLFFWQRLGGKGE